MASGNYDDRYRDYNPLDPFGDIGGIGGGFSGGGGGTGPAPEPMGDPAPEKTLQEMQVDEGATLALAYGKHVVAGNLIEYSYSSGPPPALKFITALGEGPWEGVNVFSSQNQIYYGGQLLSASGSSSTPGYKFHPGTYSSGTGDANQGTPQFFPSSPTYSGTAYVEVLLDNTQSVEERPDKFKGVFKCLKVANYNSSGTVTDAGSYSTNPARVAADLLKRAGLLTRIDWPSWVTWRDYCDATITWGAGNITRFECHAAFTAGIDIVTALSVVTQTACTYWQDDGQKIVFLPVIDNAVIDPNTTSPVHTFTTSNARNLSVINNDRRQLPTGYTAKFRDIDDEYMTEVSVEYFDAELEDQVGAPNRIEISLPPMKRSQAERICHYRTVLDGVCSVGIELIGYGDCSRVLPGDYIAIGHELVKTVDTDNYTALVTEAEDLPDSDGPGLRRIQAKLLKRAPYKDTAHTDPV